MGPPNPVRFGSRTDVQVVVSHPPSAQTDSPRLSLSSPLRLIAVPDEGDGGRGGGRRTGPRQQGRRHGRDPPAATGGAAAHAQPAYSYEGLNTPSVWRTNRTHAAAKVDAIASNGMDEIEIPAFLRKQPD